MSESRHDYSLGEAIDMAMERLRHPLVWIEDGAFIVRDEKAPGFRYDFTCRDLADAVCWVEHLAAKTWITTEHLQQFAALALMTFKGKRR